MAVKSAMITLLVLGGCLAVSSSAVAFQSAPSFPDESWCEWNQYLKTSLQEQRAATRPDIVDTAVAGGFDTLVSAVQKAGLVDVLKGEGPFTVFAPTNEAFDKVPQDKLDALLRDRDALVRVLTYHVVPGRVTAREVSALTSAKTVQGQSIRIDTSSGVRVNDARVVKADIMAGNGVIHVIDQVILPN